MHVVVTYDVSCDQRRYRIAKRLLDDAHRVQKSVFEVAHLPEVRLIRLRSDLEGIMDRDEDSLRYYRLCAACARRVEHVGTGPGQLELPLSYRIIG